MDVNERGEFNLSLTHAKPDSIPRLRSHDLIACR